MQFIQNRKKKLLAENIDENFEAGDILVSQSKNKAFETYRTHFFENETNSILESVAYSMKDHLLKRTCLEDSSKVWQVSDAIYAIMSTANDQTSSLCKSEYRKKVTQTLDIRNGQWLDGKYDVLTAAMWSLRASALLQ